MHKVYSDTEQTDGHVTQSVMRRVTTKRKGQVLAKVCCWEKENKKLFLIKSFSLPEPAP